MGCGDLKVIVVEAKMGFGEAMPDAVKPWVVFVGIQGSVNASAE